MEEAPKKSGQSHSRRKWVAFSIGPFDNTSPAALTLGKPKRPVLYVFWGGGRVKRAQPFPATVVFNPFQPFFLQKSHEYTEIHHMMPLKFKLPCLGISYVSRSHPHKLGGISTKGAFLKKTLQKKTWCLKGVAFWLGTSGLLAWY